MVGGSTVTVQTFLIHSGTDRQDIHIMGLNTANGRLGIASSSNVYRPTKLPRLLPNHDDGEYEIADIAIGRETCMIHVVDYGSN